MFVNIILLTNYVFWRLKPQIKIGKFLKYAKPYTSGVKVWKADYWVPPFSVSLSYTIGSQYGMGSRVCEWLKAGIKSEIVTNSDKPHKSQLWLQIKHRFAPCAQGTEAQSQILVVILITQLPSLAAAACRTEDSNKYQWVRMKNSFYV